MPFPTSSFVVNGEFKDIREIGQGAFGKVYYAKDNLGRDVAIKEVLPSNPYFLDARAKFEKESRIHASVQHPNIISVYRLAEDQQTKELYLICEYINGGSLEDYLRMHGPLSQPQTIKITLDMCAALGATWAQQIVHRDIKPSNILLKMDANGSITVAKLGDFGVAQDLLGGRTTIRQGMSHPGSPLYMAPEQANITNILDVRADIYALGITLWEMLTGTHYKLVQNQTSAPDPRHYNPTASADIATVIQRAIQLDPNLRYGSTQPMEDDLRVVLAGQPPRPLDQTTKLTNTSRLKRSHSGLVVVAIVTLLLLIPAFFIVPGLLEGSSQTVSENNFSTTVIVAPSKNTVTVPASGAAALESTLVVATTALLNVTRAPPPTNTPTLSPTITASQLAAVQVPTLTPMSIEPITRQPIEPTAVLIQVPPSTSTPQSPTTAPPTAVLIQVPPSTSTPQPPTAVPPTAAPAPPQCSGPLKGGFGKLWEENESVRSRIGCPLEPEQGGTDTTAEQVYEHGSMFYYNPLEQIYVLVGTNSGWWRLFPKDFLLALPTPTPADPPPCEGRLKGGFELVWRSYPEIREALGCSIDFEVGLFEGAYQPFENGTMLYSQPGLGRGKTLYVLYKNGTFERYDDPNR